MIECLNSTKWNMNASKGHRRRRRMNLTNGRSTKRCGCIAMSVSALAVAAASCVSVEAFVSLPNQSKLTTVLPARHVIRYSHNSNDHHLRSLPPTMSLSMSSSSSSRRSKNSSSSSLITTKESSLLTEKEERRLLAQVAEYHRIRKTLREHKLMHPSTLSSIQAKQCGYGEDLDGYQQAVEDGMQARETLVLRNMGLVRFVVEGVLSSKRRGWASSSSSTTSTSISASKGLKSLSKDDLIQEGSLGLARAVDRYDSANVRGARLSTYAVYWIRAAVLRCIAERDELIRVPESVSAAVKKLTRAASTMGIADLYAEELHNHRAWKQANIAKDLAEKAGLTENMVRQAAIVQQRRKLKEGYLALEDYMIQQDSRDDDHVFEIESTTSQHLKDTLSKFLSLKEMEALSWRYGLTVNESSDDSSFRDYEAEAEQDLFGPKGILASSPSLASSSSLSKTKTRTTTAFTSRNNNNKKKREPNLALSTSTSTSTSRPIPKTSPQPINKGGRWGEAMSFKEVGQQMRVSAEYTRRLCSRAMKKLHAAVESGQLDPALIL